MTGSVERTELVVRVDSPWEIEELRVLGRDLALLASLAVRESVAFEPGLVLLDARFSSLFRDQQAAAVADWTFGSPRELPGLDPPVRLLMVYPLFESEVELVNDIGVAEAYRVAAQSGSDWYRSDRSPIIQRPTTDSDSEGAPVRTEPVAESMTPSVSSSWEAIEAWYHEHAPRAATDLNPGASSDKLDTLERELGASLPEDYRESLARHNGGSVLRDYDYLAAGDIPSLREEMRETKESGAFNEPPIYAEKGDIQPVWWHGEWIPVATDSGGNLLCLDLDPGPQGVKGQVIRWESVEGPSATGHASFADWLASYAHDLRAGRYETDEEGTIQLSG